MITHRASESVGLYCATNARFYQLRINLGIAIPRSEDNPRFILGSSFSVLSTFSNLGITNLTKLASLYTKRR